MNTLKLRDQASQFKQAKDIAFSSAIHSTNDANFVMSFLQQTYVTYSAYY
jgi:hypothetical protein